MKKILGTRRQYYIQTNNAQVALFRDYFGRGKNIACGPESFAMGLDIAGYDMSIFTPGEQPGDSILMIAHNPLNLKKFQKRRKLDYDRYPPNEVPQVYDVIGRILYDRKVCQFSYGLSFSIIKHNIDNGVVMQVSGKFPAGGHYVLIVGYDRDRIIYNDPYPPQWADKKGYRRQMSIDWMDKHLHNHRIDIFPNKKSAQKRPSRNANYHRGI